MLEVYLITRLTALNGFFFAVAIITGIIAVVCGIVYCVNLAEGFSYDYEPPFLKKWIRNCTITCVAFTLFNIFTPTTKDAMIIMILVLLWISYKKMKMFNNYLINV